MSKQQKIEAILDRTLSGDAPHAPAEHYLSPKRSGSLDPQLVLQQNATLYKLIHDVLTPTLSLQRWQDEVPDPTSHIVVNMGSGVTRLHPELINVDRVPFPEVDILADFSRPLPIRSGSVDAVLSIAVLEHLRAPDFMASEIRRVLKPGGLVFIATPFLFPFHEAPEDYARWTVPGMQKLLGDSFEVVSAGPRGGAMGVVILALSHAVAQVLCFGSEKLYTIANFAMMGLLAPLKLLDLVLARLPFAVRLSPNIYVTARKR
ncbi:MAG TPA: methyltransferase domain-containing protein [Methylomirabilota bacterium]|jgi:SAM-dependent methyltransferase|nr:methyltransferase domain-containing protein [Methylomirabilota bacterium]